MEVWAGHPQCLMGHLETGNNWALLPHLGLGGGRGVVRMLARKAKPRSGSGSPK